MGSSFSRGVYAAKVSVSIFIAVGLAELSLGSVSGSMALLADGAHTFTDAIISLIVWLGLRNYGKIASESYNYGYNRAETAASIVAAFVMVIVGTIILVRSYTAFLNPVGLSVLILPLVTAAVATIVSFAIAVYKLGVARFEGSQALRLDAYNTVKSGLSSLLAFIGILLSDYFVWMDAAAGIVISFFIFTVVYFSLKESAAVLTDARIFREVEEAVRSVAEGVEGVKRVRSINTRRLEKSVICELCIDVDRSMTVEEADRITRKIDSSVKVSVADEVKLTVQVEPKYID